MGFILRLLVTAVALAAAAYFVTGIHTGGFGAVLLTALVFGVVNALIRPIVKMATCPFYALTLGLFTFVVNALMLMLTGWLSGKLGIEFSVAGFWPALWGSLVVSVVSTLLSFFLPDGKE
jgi:putative membrane protein